MVITNTGYSKKYFIWKGVPIGFQLFLVRFSKKGPKKPRRIISIELLVRFILGLKILWISPVFSQRAINMKYAAKKPLKLSVTFILVWNWLTMQCMAVCLWLTLINLSIFLLSAQADHDGTSTRFHAHCGTTCKPKKMYRLKQLWW